MHTAVSVDIFNPQMSFVSLLGRIMGTTILSITQAFTLQILPRIIFREVVDEVVVMLKYTHTHIFLFTLFTKKIMTIYKRYCLKEQACPLFDIQKDAISIIPQKKKTSIIFSFQIYTILFLAWRMIRMYESNVQPIPIKIK